MVITQVTSHCDCANDSYTKGQKGLTYYAKAPPNPYLSPGGGNWTAGWTGTTPRCYAVPNGGACLVSFDVLIDGNSSNYDVPVDMYLKNTKIGTIVHSRIQGHDFTQIMDLAPYSSTLYNDTGRNDLKLVNNSNVGVYINNFRIMRAYGMCYLPTDTAGQCNTASCKSRITYAANGNLDSSRNDCPCNYDSRDSCGGLSFTKWGPDNGQGSSIGPNQTRTWTFDIPTYIYQQNPNYQGPAICFFNFNNVDISSQVNDNDARFSISLNGHLISDMYHSRRTNSASGGNIGPGIDLVKWPQYFNDSPGARNTVTLWNRSSTNLLLMDGNPPGNIDIYRMYNTTKLC